MNGLGDAREPVAAPALFPGNRGQVAGAVGVAVCGDIPGRCEGAGEGEEKGCKGKVFHIDGVVAFLDEDDAVEAVVVQVQGMRILRLIYLNLTSHMISKETVLYLDKVK